MIINFGAIEMHNNINSGVFGNMNRVRAVELSLIAQRAYDPGDYIAEISEIFECITGGKNYDDAPELTKFELISILENLTADSKHLGKYSIRNILIQSDKSQNINEKKESLKKVQAILFA